MSSFDHCFAAEVLLTAYVAGDRAAVELHGVSFRTVERYRQHLRKDEQLRALYTARVAEQRDDWQQARCAFLRRGLAKLSELVEATDDPSQIHAVAAAVKLVGELELTERAIDPERASEGQAAGKAARPASPSLPTVHFAS